MSRALGRWRWPLMAGLGCSSLFLLVSTLYGQSTGLPADATWFQFFIVGLGGTALLAVWRMRDDGRAVRQALLGYGGEDGLVADVRHLKEWVESENGHRKSLSQSVSRLDQGQAMVERRVEALEDLAREVAPKLGVPFGGMSAREMQRRERDAG